MPTIHRAVDALVSSSDLAGILVTEGPGGFSHVRRGVALANALGFAWSIPVAPISSREGGVTNEVCALGIVRLLKQPQSLVIPAYGQEPNITKKKQ